MPSNTDPRRTREQGWALLTILFFSALLVISLGSVLPRAAMEARREREGDLIHRGKQYERAIQLYFRKFRRYPAKLEDLENTNNIRFLRKRFTDPITGGEEWRLLNIGPNGVLTNSALQPPGNPGAVPGTGVAVGVLGSAPASQGPTGFGQQPTGFGQQPAGFGQPVSFGQQPSGFGQQPGPGGQPPPGLPAGVIAIHLDCSLAWRGRFRRWPVLEVARSVRVCPAW